MGAGTMFRASPNRRSRQGPDLSTIPAAGFFSPAARLNRMLLPEPLSPARPITTPSGAAASKSRNGASVTRRKARAIDVRIATAHMDDSEILGRMRADWNERAGEDANYYVAFGRREQDDDEFLSTATDVLRLLTASLKRLRGFDAALEIGCGPGRLMRPLSYHFGEIHGVDVSDEMIHLARKRLWNFPNAHPHLSSGADLAIFPDERFDFVYSYAVFQHIPSREVVFNYLRESRRVLKTGGILRCQINGLPAHASHYDTWRDRKS